MPWRPNSRDLDGIVRRSEELVAFLDGDVAKRRNIDAGERAAWQFDDLAAANCRGYWRSERAL